MKEPRAVFAIFIFGFFCLFLPVESQDFNPSFHLKLSGGMGTLDGGDFNTGIDGINTKLIDLSALSGFATVSSMDHLKWGADLSIEAIMDITPFLAASIGIGYIRRDLDTTGEIEVMDIGTAALILKPTFSAVPIELNLYYTVPLFSSLNVFFKAGGSYYLGKADFSYREEETLVGAPTVWEYSKGTGNAASLGLQGGIGLEYGISERIGLFLEAAGRYANFKNWDYDGKYENSVGTSQSFKGTWYYAEAYDETTDDYYASILLENETPSGWYLRNVRKAEVDFSGLSFRAGIKIRLGKK